MEVSTDARRRSVDADGASGVDGAGSVNVNVCTVEAGCRVEAMISTSRGKDSWGDKNAESINGHKPHTQSTQMAASYFTDVLMMERWAER